ncbi:hypothetical protein BU26DRAFT_403778, partial [Trematosphaeria pertusa]
LLPAPFASSSLLLGQLLVDPLNPEYQSVSTGSSHSVEEPVLRAGYKDIILQDDEGRLVSSLADRLHFPQDNLLLVQAEQMSYTSLKSPHAAFEGLRRSDVHSFLRKMALRDQPLYYVTGIQKLKNPSFKRAVVREGSIAEAPASSDTKLRLPTHVRRDSTMDLEETSNDAIFGAELRKVRCRVGAPEEPHAIEDIDYSWTYHKLDGLDDLQLAIGLGKVLQAAELRALAGIVHDE